MRGWRWFEGARCKLEPILLRRLEGGGPDVMRDGVSVLKPRGGTAVIIGNAHAGEKLVIDPQQFNQGKRILGTWGGDSDPDRDYPRYAKLMTAGKINLAPTALTTYSLADINQALEDLAKGRVIRPVVDMAK